VQSTRFDAGPLRIAVGLAATLLWVAPAAATDPADPATPPDPASATASADPASPDPAVDDLPVYDVYVTSPKDVVTTVTTTREITREDMTQEGARTLDEAVVHQPSLVVRTGGEGSPRLDIRGLRTRQILTLIDGVPFYSTEDDAFDPSLIPTQMIERVDLTYSNSSVLYGDGPIAGIVQIRTRSGEEGLQVGARGDFRSAAQELGELSVAGGCDDFEGFAAGRYYDGNGWDLPGSFDPTDLEGGGRRDNSDRNQGNFFGKLGYRIDDGARVDALGSYWNAEYGVPWRVEQQTDFVGRARFERVDEVSGFNAQLSGQVDANEHVGIRSWGYVTRQVEHRSGWDDMNLDTMEERGAFRLRGTTLISGGAVHGRIDDGAFGTLRLAANGRYEQFESAGRIRDVPLGMGNFGFRDVDQQNGLGAGSFAWEYAARPTESLGLVLGYGHAFLNGDGGVSDDGSLFLAGAYLDLPTGTRLRGSAAHKLRFPSLRQLYDTENGNTDLDSERCWCFEVGVAQDLPAKTTVGLTGFWLELSDFIERDDTTDLFENRQELESRGVEVELVNRFFDGLLVRFGYTFLDTRDRSDDSPFDRLDNRPRHKIDAELRYRFPTNTTFRAAVTWMGDNIIYTRNAPFTSSELDDFTLLDLRLEQDCLDDRVSVYFGVDNVTDEQSEINVAFPQAGRSIYGGVELQF